MMGGSGVQRKWFTYCRSGLGTHCARKGSVETSSSTPQNTDCQCYGHELAFQLSSSVAEAGGVFEWWMETVKKTSIEGNNLRYCWHGVMKVGSPMGMTFFSQVCLCGSYEGGHKWTKRADTWSEKPPGWKCLLLSRIAEHYSLWPSPHLYLCP